MQTAPDEVVDIIFPDECIQFFYECMIVAMLHLYKTKSICANTFFQSVLL
jgi:hypothetical protein